MSPGHGTAATCLQHTHTYTHRQRQRQRQQRVRGQEQVGHTHIGDILTPFVRFQRVFKHSDAVHSRPRKLWRRKQGKQRSIGVKRQAPTHTHRAVGWKYSVFTAGSGPKTRHITLTHTVCSIFWGGHRRKHGGNAPNSHSTCSEQRQCGQPLAHTLPKHSLPPRLSRLQCPSPAETVKPRLRRRRRR